MRFKNWVKLKKRGGITYRQNTKSKYVPISTQSQCLVYSQIHNPNEDINTHHKTQTNKQETITNKQTTY